MTLLVLIFIKDTFGGFAPLIKKPLDAIEVLLVNHASLILIVFPVVMNQVAKSDGCAVAEVAVCSSFSGPVVYAATLTVIGCHIMRSAWRPRCCIRLSDLRLPEWCGCWGIASTCWR